MTWAAILAIQLGEKKMLISSFKFLQRFKKIKAILMLIILTRESKIIAERAKRSSIWLKTAVSQEEAYMLIITLLTQR